MSITIYMGLPGSGKSSRLIELVNAAIAQGHPVLTFACSDSPWLNASDLPAGKYIRSHRLLGSRRPGMTTPLDHFVSVDECAAILSRTPPSTLVAFDEAYHFGPDIVPHWLDASQRGLEVLIVSPSEPQLELLEGHEYTATTLPMMCERCSNAEASTFLVLPGENVTLSVCANCDKEMTDAARHEILKRLERQPPYPGEKAIYQPVELEECVGWRVLRPDSKVRADLMTRVLHEVGLPDDRSSEHMTYLDIGCNTGFFCHHMRQLGFFAEGVDVVEGDIAVARLLDSFIRRDNNTYVVADAYDYLRDTQNQQFDITSAFAVFQWLMIQTSVEQGIACLEWLFAKTKQVCFLEMGYSAEAHYNDKIVGAHIDRAWVRNIMEEKGGFSEIRIFDG